jgi:DNA-binding transcriptional LysR family regulator
MFTLEQITVFDTVCQLNSYSAAGRFLGKKRSTIREHIVALEDSLNCQLFYIEGKKVLPTTAAKLLQRRANNLVKHAKDLQEATLNLADTSLNELVICHDSLFPHAFILELQQTLRQQFPTLQLRFNTLSRQQAYRGLIEGNVHLALLASEELAATSSEHEFINLGSLRLRVYSAAKSEFASTEDVSIEDLRLNTQWVAEGMEDGIARRAISNQCHFVDELSLLLAMVSHDGWAILPEASVGQAVETGKLKTLEVKELRNDLLQSICVFFPIAANTIQELEVAVNICQRLSSKYFE